MEFRFVYVDKWSLCAKWSLGQAWLLLWRSIYLLFIDLNAVRYHLVMLWMHISIATVFYCDSLFNTESMVFSLQDRSWHAWDLAAQASAWFKHCVFLYSVWLSSCESAKSWASMGPNCSCFSILRVLLKSMALFLGERQTGFSPWFRNWVPIIGNSKISGCLIFQGRSQ